MASVAILGQAAGDGGLAFGVGADRALLPALSWLWRRAAVRGAKTAGKGFRRRSRMLSIAKINAASTQSACGGKGYLHYLGESSRRQRTDFDDYSRGDKREGPEPFWACKGPALLGLDHLAEAEHVERLARGFHPITGEPLVKGAGAGHVMGLDMTFSAPKDFSAVFAGADAKTRNELLMELRCLRPETDD